MLDCGLATRRKPSAVPPPLPSPAPAAGLRTSFVRACRLRLHPRLPPDSCLSVHVSHAHGQIHRWIIIYRLLSKCRYRHSYSPYDAGQEGVGWQEDIERCRRIRRRCVVPAPLRPYVRLATPCPPYLATIFPFHCRRMSTSTAVRWPAGTSLNTR